MSRVLNKYRGTLVGALVGDCLGSHYEGIFSIIPWGEVTNYTMTRIKDIKDSIPYTDDTAMTRAICKSLTEQKKYDNSSMAHEFVKEFFRDSLRGYGQAVGKVFERLRDENPEDVTLPARSQFDGQGSYGNGAAMRISPLALFSKNPTEVKEVRYVDISYPHRVCSLFTCRKACSTCISRSTGTPQYPGTSPKKHRTPEKTRDIPQENQEQLHVEHPNW